MNKPIIISIAILLIVACFFIKAQIGKIELPVPIMCESEQIAHQLAGFVATPILGTGSMFPLIPLIKPGQDPYKTVVAYVTFKSASKFKDIKKGSLIKYKPIWSKYDVMHVAVEQDGDGWICSGINNSRSEPQYRVTNENFLGIVDKIYVWK